MLRLANGRWRPLCRPASLEADATQALAEIAADRVHVRGAGEPAAAPRAGARIERPELVGLRRLAKCAADRTPYELGPRSAGAACDAVEKVELVAPEVHLCSS